MPFAITVAPPSEVTLPPLCAEDWVIKLTEEVLTTGIFAIHVCVVKLIVSPYPVPNAFVAYALT